MNPVPQLMTIDICFLGKKMSSPVLSLFAMAGLFALSLPLLMVAKNSKMSKLKSFLLFRFSYIS